MASRNQGKCSKNSAASNRSQRLRGETLASSTPKYRCSDQSFPRASERRDRRRGRAAPSLEVHRAGQPIGISQIPSCLLDGIGGRDDLHPYGVP